MDKKIGMLFFVRLFQIVGFVPSAGAQGGGGAIPIITQCFPAKEIRPGETWKIYLNASDPMGAWKIFLRSSINPVWRNIQ